MSHLGRTKDGQAGHYHHRRERGLLPAQEHAQTRQSARETISFTRALVVIALAALILAGAAAWPGRAPAPAFADGAGSPDACWGNIPGPGGVQLHVDSSVNPGDNGTDQVPGEDWEFEFTYSPETDGGYPAGTIVTGVCIKTGGAGHSDPLGNGDYEGDFDSPPANDDARCYSISGVNTTEVTVMRWYESGQEPACQAISHLDFVTDADPDEPDFTLTIRKLCVGGGSYVIDVDGPDTDYSETFACDTSDTIVLDEEGTYAVSEQGDLDPIFGGDCDSEGEVVIPNPDDQQQVEFVCTVENADPFLVHKTFSDDADIEVTVELDCGDGVTVTPETDTASPGEPAEFSVIGHEGEDVTCTATETVGAEGYESDGPCEALLSEGECTINNDPEGEDPASITIIKSVPGTDDQEFDFESNIPDCGDFELVDDGPGGEPGSILCDNLPEGEYTVEEDVPDGWELDEIECSGGDFDVDEPRVTIDLEDGDDVTCRFFNVREEEDEEENEERPRPRPTIEVDEVESIQPTPTPTRVVEVEPIRQLPSTGSGGPAADAGGSLEAWAGVAGAIGFAGALGLWWRARRLS